MKKLLLLIALVATAMIFFSSCTSYTCPTYSLENTQDVPTELAQENL